MTTIPHPGVGEYADWYKPYITMVAQSDLMQVLEEQVDRLFQRLSPLTDERALHRYAEGKWSVKEVVNHVSDAERIFAYRLLRIARADETPLAPFDENRYVETCNADARSMTDLLDELRAVRGATLALVRSINDEAWERRGTASGHPISARGLAGIIAGHFEHHLRILGERYGV